MNLFKKKKPLDDNQQAVHDIFERVRAAMQLKNFSALEKYIEKSTGWISHSIKRANKPYELADRVAQDKQVSLDYLMFGKAPEAINENDLLTIKNGVRTGVLEASMFGFINENLSHEEVENITKIIAAKIEAELQQENFSHKKTA